MKDPTNKGYWQKVAGIYDRFMAKDAPAYAELCGRIRATLKGTERVLELAAGTGIIARSIAGAAREVEATDFSPRMIERASSRPRPPNLSFAVADACALAYPDSTFDAVVIANALHIMPDPRRALAEIRRVLKDDGVLFAPTFTHGRSFRAAVLGRLMALTGFRVHASWTPESYQAFLEGEGWTVVERKAIAASFPLCYVEARKNRTGA